MDQLISEGYVVAQAASGLFVATALPDEMLTSPAEAFWVAYDPDKQSGPRCIEVLFFVALGNGEHAWQCLDPTCGVTVAF
jgi:hypothetical protein